MTKKVYFYRIYIYKPYVDKTEGPKVRAIKPNEFLELIQGIIGAHSKTKTQLGYDIVIIPDDPDKTAIEIVELNDRYLYARIGKEDDIKFLGQRNNSTGASSNLPVAVGSHPEKFTYFCIHLSTGIMSFLSVQGAPKSKHVHSFLSMIEDNGYTPPNIMPIATENVLETLKHKTKVNSLSCNVCVPADQFLGYNFLGIKESTFKRLKNVDRINLSFTISGKRNKNVTFEPAESIIALGKREADHNALISCFEEIKSKHGDNLKNAKAKAADKLDEKSELYDLFEDCITACIEMPITDAEKDFVDFVKTLLITAYNKKENILLLTSR